MLILGSKKHLLLLSMLKIFLLLIIFVEIVKHVSEFFEEENIQKNSMYLNLNLL